MGYIMETKINKQSVAREMVREIAGDIGSLVSRSARATVNMTKTTAKFASLPLVGMLSQETRERIYDDDWLVKASMKISCYTNFPAYACAGSLAGSFISEEAAKAGGFLCAVYSIFEGLAREVEYSQAGDSHGTLPGLLPSYILKKYHNAKKNIERDVKGGDE
jgi:hypothetical protein